MEAKRGLCPCGMPQSYPIPHEHDLTDREKLIKDASFKAGQDSVKEWIEKQEEHQFETIEGYSDCTYYCVDRKKWQAFLTGLEGDKK